MIPYSNPNPSSGGGLSVGAIIGIAVGGGLAVVLIVTLLICWRRRSRTSKNASSGGGQGQFKSSGDAVMEAGVSGISDLPTMKQRPQAASGLLYGSAFSTGTAAVGGSGSSARNASLESSVGLLGGLPAGEGLLSAGPGPEDDPLLEWILKSQLPTTPEAAASAAAVAAAAAASAETAAASASGSHQGTPKYGSSGSRYVDMRAWQFTFRDLQIQKQIGEGSFGRVSDLSDPAAG